ncbi:MAG: sugar phosphate isomerase/epimerase [Victivallaceae bacterium]
MKLGLFLHGHFYEKLCGKPAFKYVNDENKKVRETHILSSGDLYRLTPEAVRLMLDCGVECIELFNTPEKLNAIIPFLKDLNNIDIIIHEFDNCDGYPSTNTIAAANNYQLAVIRENLKWLIDIAMRMNAQKIVLHTPRLDTLDFINKKIDADFVDTVRNKWLELLHTCSGFAEKCGVILAVENEVNKENEWHLIQCAEDLAAAVDEIHSPNVKCAFDVAHANIGFSPLKYAQCLGERITHVHWHDNDGLKDQHLPPGKGNIDFTAVMKYLLAAEAKNREEITLTLECDKPSVDYEAELRKVKIMRDKILRG